LFNVKPIAMRKNLSVLVTLLVAITLHAQQPLTIPAAISGTSFNLNVRDTTHVFYPGFTTSTYGVNASYLGPTLIMNKGDSVSISVNNFLMDTTTMHWHGLHVSAMNDGGPHNVIPPGTSWQPTFRVRDHAATYWYHPHLHMMTNLHVTRGAAGLIIVRDSAEALLNLPRTYGVDDFPLVIQSKCFDASKQIQINNAYDSVMLVNGTVNPFLNVPAQVVRLRLLNASPERVYQLGFLGNLSFQQIGSDGGLLDAPVALTRLRLAPGERAEILVNFSGMNGQSFTLMSFASELPSAIYGASQPGMGPGQTITGYTQNPLNGADFSVLQFNVTAPTSSAVTSIPSTLITNTAWPVSSVNTTRTLTFSPVNMGPTAIQGPFLINNTSFDMHTINYSIPLNNIEIWTLTNQSPIAHPFHIHDVQFYITEVNGAPPAPNMAGRKDVVLVPAMQTVKFITQFETFCDDSASYMYHCHMLPHEDEGMMGQFVVTCPAGTGFADEKFEQADVKVFPNPGSGFVNLLSGNSEKIIAVRVFDTAGRELNVNKVAEGAGVNVDLREYETGIYFLRVSTTASESSVKYIHTR
jgi:FtsP/CotA-like multicopper oxidase with cupredoxin domain